MANQYSITVSDNADKVLKELKNKGLKISQGISAAIELLGPNAIGNLIALKKSLEYYMKEDSE
ncbi:MAG: hypothetical protein ACR2NF_10400 [Pirellulales bacterium]